MPAIPSMSLEAERAALGSILLGGVAVLRTIGLPPSAFYLESHRAIYQAMLRLVERGEAPDIITVQSELARAHELDLAGGPAALALLVEEGSIAVNVPNYARIIAEHAQRREYAALAQRLATANGAEIAALATIVRDAEALVRNLAPATPETIPIEATAFLAHRFPARPDLIARGVLPRAGLLVINGRPKVHKSMLADNLLLARTRGAPWLGLATDPGVTLALQAEHSPASWQRRLAAMTKHDPEPLPQNRLYLRTLRGVALNTADGLGVVHRLLDETHANLVRLDPLARFMVGRENSNDEDGMGGVVRAIDTILDRGVGVLLVHHQGKPVKDDPRTGGLSLRGGSALYAAADAILTVERDGPDAVTVAFELRDGPALPPLRLTVMPDLWLVPTGADPELLKVGAIVARGPLPYTTVRAAAQTDLGLTRATATRRISAAVDAKVLRKDEDGLYIAGPAYLPAGSRAHSGSPDA